jgi:hypothetical protein
MWCCRVPNQTHAQASQPTACDWPVDCIMMDALLWRLQAGGGVTLAHLNACVWEFGCGASGAAVPARVAEELAALPPAALPTMVRGACPSCCPVQHELFSSGSRLQRKHAEERRLQPRRLRLASLPLLRLLTLMLMLMLLLMLLLLLLLLLILMLIYTSLAYRARAGRLTLPLTDRSHRGQIERALADNGCMPGWRSLELPTTHRMSCRHQVGRTPLSIVNGVVRHLAGLPAALGHVAKVIHIHVQLFALLPSVALLVATQCSRGSATVPWCKARLVFLTQRRKRTW